MWSPVNITWEEGAREGGREGGKKGFNFLCMNNLQTCAEVGTRKEEGGGREARTKAEVQTCGESNGYLELNLNCRTKCSPSYKVPSGPLRWIFQLHSVYVCWHVH